jgi:hypothetical protein
VLLLECSDLECVHTRACALHQLEGPWEHRHSLGAKTFRSRAFDPILYSHNTREEKGGLKYLGVEGLWCYLYFKYTSYKRKVPNIMIEWFVFGRSRVQISVWRLTIPFAGFVNFLNPNALLMGVLALFKIIYFRIFQIDYWATYLLNSGEQL